MNKGSDFKHLGGDSVFDVVLFADMLKDRDMNRLLCVPIPFCYYCVHNVSVSCPRDMFLPSPPLFSVDFYWLIQFTIWTWCKSLPRMLVMCLSNLLWWQYFLYLKKEYCGLLGGLIFYRIRHICKSDKTEKKKYPKMKSSLFCTGHVQTQLCTKMTLFMGYVLFPSAT